MIKNVWRLIFFVQILVLHTTHMYLTTSAVHTSTHIQQNCWSQTIRRQQTQTETTNLLATDKIMACAINNLGKIYEILNKNNYHLNLSSDPWKIEKINNPHYAPIFVPSRCWKHACRIVNDTLCPRCSSPASSTSAGTCWGLITFFTLSRVRKSIPCIKLSYAAPVKTNKLRGGR